MFTSLENWIFTIIFSFYRAIDKTDPLKRTRNVSGSRPISAAVIDYPDPLELLVPETEEMVSYGYLLSPSATKLSVYKQIMEGSDSMDFQMKQKPTFITR